MAIRKHIAPLFLFDQMCLISDEPQSCASQLTSSAVEASSSAIEKNSSKLDPAPTIMNEQLRQASRNPSLPIKSSMKRRGMSNKKKVKKTVRFAAAAASSSSSSQRVDNGNSSDPTCDTDAHQKIPQEKDTPSFHQTLHKSSKVKTDQEDQAVRTDIISYLQPASTMTESQLAEVFWQPEDYEIFRSTASYIASEIRRVSQLKGQGSTTATPDTNLSEQGNRDGSSDDSSQTSAVPDKQKNKRNDALDYDAVMKTVYQLCMYHSESISKVNKENVPPSQDLQAITSPKLSKHHHHRSGKIHPASHVPTTTATSSANSQQQQQLLLPPSQNQIYDDNQMCLPPNLFHALTQWVKAGHSRRGLEKFSVSFQVQARPMQRRSAIRSVLVAQQYLRQQQRQRKNHGFDIYPHGNEEFLRSVSEQFSRTSKLFGIVMGHADAAAVGHMSV